MLRRNRSASKRTDGDTDKDLSEKMAGPQWRRSARGSTVLGGGLLDDAVSIGDDIALYCDESGGYVFNFQSSLGHNKLSAFHNQSRDHPEDVPDPYAITFRIYVRNRCQSEKKLKKLNEEIDKRPEDAGLKSRIPQLQELAEEERRENEAEQNRQFGKDLRYGQVIQLQHLYTQRFVHVSTTQTSNVDKNNMMVSLEEANSKQAQFRILPRFKVKSEGDVVQVKDKVVLESIRSPGQYLHSSAPTMIHGAIHGCEINSAVYQTGFTVARFYHRPSIAERNLVRGGSFVRLFHKEFEAYLVAEGIFNRPFTEDVHLRIVTSEQPETSLQAPSTSATTYWQIEQESSILKGDVIAWKQHIRFRHITTRLYLSVQADGRMSLVSKGRDPMTVFRLHPVIKTGPVVELETYTRIEHVLTERWVHADKDHEYEKRGNQGLDNRASATQRLRWDEAPCRQVQAVAESKDDDAFTIQKVAPRNVDDARFVAGAVPALQHLLRDIKAGNSLQVKRLFENITALEEVEQYLYVDGKPTKQRQNLLRNFMVVDLLIEFLRTDRILVENDEVLMKLKVAAYSLLETYLKGDSRENELYMAKYIDFFTTQFKDETEIGHQATSMITELIRDNRKVLDRISPAEIEGFVRLVKERKNHLYLDLLGVLCVCDEVALPDNQNFIAKKWLVEEQSGVILTEYGDRINRDSGVVYVSTDLGATWQSMHDFCQVSGRTRERSEEYLFLEHQLDLFGKLCLGRNAYCTKVLARDRNYLTWNEAFLCLTDDHLPDALRAKYCNLVIGLFVDTGNNRSVIDQRKLSFAYDELGQDMLTKVVETLPKDSRKMVGQLQTWLNNFFHDNRNMTASEIGRNKLIEQVLRLLHHLVSYGYCTQTNDIRDLLQPLRGLLDGRNDKPFKLSEDRRTVSYKGKIHEKEDYIQRYKEEYRFHKSPEAKAICDAKYRAMEICELFMDIEHNIRLEKFLQSFKEYGGNDATVKKKALLGRFTEMMESTALFDDPFVDILMDIFSYDYSKMVVKSMHLLNRYYTVYQRLFDQAVLAQVLNTVESERVHKVVVARLPALRRLKGVRMGRDEAAGICNILKEFTRFCHQTNEPDEPHSINQTILMNNGILDIIVTLVSQQLDVELTAQYQALRRVVQAALVLLQFLTKGNKAVQTEVFEQLDLLLAIRGVEAELGAALLQVFTGNEDTCLRVQVYQIQTIMQRAAKLREDAAEFLDLLAAIVKIEERNLPLKRNQKHVMAALMQNYHQVARVLEQPVDVRQTILRNTGDPKQLSYLISLIDILASCAEGENPTIESQCQKAVHADEVIATLNDPSVNNNLKRPYLRFLLWAYVNTGVSALEAGLLDLPHKIQPWMRDFARCIMEVTNWVLAHKDVTCRLLKRAPPKSAVSDTPEGWAYGTLHFFFDAAFPFLAAFYKRNFDAEKSINTEIGKALLKFADAVAPLLCDSHQMHVMRQAATAVLPRSDVDRTEITRFTKQQGRGDMTREISAVQEKYFDYYKAEKVLNQNVNAYAERMRRYYHGNNTVEAQLHKIHSPSRPYTEEAGYEALPLGQEFQDMVSCFVAPKEKATSADGRPLHPWRRFKKLIKALQISATKLSRKDQRDPAQVALDVKCLQIMRAMIHNAERRLPKNWETKKSALHEKILSRICNAQRYLNSCDAIVRTMPLISCDNDVVLGQYLAFLAAMFLNANKASQSAMEKYFLGTREEIFFFVIKSRLHESIKATKEKRSLASQAESRQKDDDAQAGTLIAAAFAIRPLEALLKTEGKKMKKEKLNNGFIPTLKLDGEGEQGDARVADGAAEEEDVYGIRLLLKVLAYMCDGQNTVLQDYLRVQPDNIKSVDIVAEITLYLDLLYSRVGPNNVGLVTQLFSTLNEFASGNPENHQVIFDNNIVEYINFILRADLSAVPPATVMELHDTISRLLMSLVEENSPATRRLVEDVASTVDREAVRGLAVKYHGFHMSPPKGAFTGRLKGWVIDVGFRYHFILQRFDDLGVRTTRRDGAQGDDVLNVMKFYTNSSMSIEVLVDGELQRVRFRVQDKEVLRPEVKELVKWSIDRSSSSNKLRDLLEWSNDIIDDIFYQRKISTWRAVPILVRGWSFWNFITLFLSLIINIFMVATWDSRGALGKTDLTNRSTIPAEIKDPRPLLPEFYNPVLWTLGGLHNFFSIILFVTYILSNNPRMPKLSAAVDWFMTTCHRKVGKPQRPSHLRANLLGFRTVFYVVFVAMSFCGTFYYGYFFAFHLLNIVYNNNLLQQVIRAVTQHGKALLWVALLGIFVLYIFTLVAFGLMRSSMDPNAEQTLYCFTLFQCLVTVLRFGLLGELFEFMRPHALGLNFSTFGLTAIFHVAFFIVITTIGLNIVFGIILDTFSELRATKTEAENDMRSQCFICSRSSFEFERFASGFENHVKRDHNMWTYIFFLIHLRETDENDYTNIEQHVSNLLKESKLDFFPIGRAMSLANEEDDRTQSQLRELIAMVGSLINTQKQQESEQQRERERDHQELWESRHRGAAALLMGTTDVLGRLSDRSNPSHRSDPSDGFDPSDGSHPSDRFDPSDGSDAGSDD